jgi:hypothetical protein
MSKQLKDRAFNLYAPPFTYQMGYIYDSKHKMVADDTLPDPEHLEPGIALRIRGWGHIQKHEDPAALQDSAGDLIAQALTQFWEDSYGKFATPDLLAYAEAEEKAHQLWELGEACHRGDGPTIADYFEALEGDFPEIAAKCPLMTEDEILIWHGEALEPLQARWDMYYLGEGEESISWLLGAHLMALRSVALAKARGEEPPHKID